MSDLPEGTDDPTTDPEALEAAIFEALNDFKDPAGFFSLAEDPEQLDSESQKHYVGMSAEEAASAVRNGSLKSGVSPSL
jgi:hypothetical protein